MDPKALINAEKQSQATPGTSLHCTVPTPVADEFRTICKQNNVKGPAVLARLVKMFCRDYGEVAPPQ